jgi:hypothetical protein
MHKIYPVIVSIFIIIAIQSCSKRSTPNRTAANTETNGTNSPAIKKNDSLITIKPVIKRKLPEAVPKVIVVNDKYANKSVDGRYYYDLQGHRYWRSNRDGKYYLFNKSMQTDDAFKKPSQ